MKDIKLTLDQRKKNEEVLNSVFNKCRENEEFKDKFIENPTSVLEEITGEKVGFFGGKERIVVEDQTDSNKVYLNIPVNQEFNDIELTERELELVAGGFVCGGLCIGIAIGIGVLIGVGSTIE